MKSRLIKGAGQSTVQKGGIGSGLCKRGWAGALYGGGTGPCKVRSKVNKSEHAGGGGGRTLYSTEGRYGAKVL